jgi:hypothetical protein
VDEEKSIETMVEDTTGKWATGGEAARDCGGRGLGAGGRERRHPEAAGQAHVVELMWDAIFYDEDALHLHRYYLQVHK